MLWAVLLLLNLVWICLFAFCRLHLGLAHNCYVVVGGGGGVGLRGAAAPKVRLVPEEHLIGYVAAF